MESQVFGNTTTGFSWIPNPTARGTSDILQGCLITIGLCVWTAVHLNIPEDGDPSVLGLSQQTWRKCVWVLLGLFAPELLIYTAWYQRFKATEFMNAYNEAFELKPKRRSLITWCKSFFENSDEAEAEADAEDGGSIFSEKLEENVKREPWTLIHGFYAFMGGFAVDTTAQEITQEYHLPESRIRLDLSRFESLLKRRKEQFRKHRYTVHNQPQGRAQPPDERPPPQPQTDLTRALNISKEEILDKSNANGLAKSLICIQSAWFCIQCLARLIQNLPLSLLEVNTAVHALAALTVYLFWWQKPLDIEQPTPLLVDTSDKLRLWAWTFHSHPGCLVCLAGEKAYSAKQIARATRRPRKEPIPLRRANERVDFDKTYIPLEGGQSINGVLSESFIHPGTGIWWPSSKLESKFNRFNMLHTSYYENGSWTIMEPVRCFHLANVRKGFRRAGNFPDFEESVPGIQITFLLLTIAYGGLHALAWNSHFPADIQQLLWRVSSVVIMCGGCVISIFNWLRGRILYSPSWAQRDRPLQVERWMKFAYMIAVPCKLMDVEALRIRDPKWTDAVGWIISGFKWLTIIAYGMARVYIVVDCFIQLFHLAPGPFFEQPLWSIYFPHFG